MDELSSTIALALGKFIGRNIDCGLHCDVTELGWAEYLLLVLIFLTIAIGAKKAISKLKDNSKKDS